MARTSREFQLVLLGAGLLTAGSFHWPDPVLFDIAANKANDPNGGGTGTDGRRSRVGYVMFLHTRSSPSRTMPTGSTVRSEFGSSGSRFSTGS